MPARLNVIFPLEFARNSAFKDSSTPARTVTETASCILDTRINSHSKVAENTTLEGFTMPQVINPSIKGQYNRVTDRSFALTLRESTNKRDYLLCLSTQYQLAEAGWLNDFVLSYLNPDRKVAYLMVERKTILEHPYDHVYMVSQHGDVVTLEVRLKVTDFVTTDTRATNVASLKLAYPDAFALDFHFAFRNIPDSMRSLVVRDSEYDVLPSTDANYHKVTDWKTQRREELKLVKKGDKDALNRRPATIDQPTGPRTDEEYTEMYECPAPFAVQTASATVRTVSTGNGTSSPKNGGCFAFFQARASSAWRATQRRFQALTDNGVPSERTAGTSVSAPSAVDKVSMASSSPGTIEAEDSQSISNHVSGRLDVGWTAQYESPRPPFDASKITTVEEASAAQAARPGGRNGK